MQLGLLFRGAHLEPSEELIDGLDLSEAAIVRPIYQLTTEHNWSAVRIADHLTALGVSPAYIGDGRQILRGKRKQATAGVWRPGRIGSLITDTIYNGLHSYGKHSKKPREIIERAVPAPVSEETWERAQEVMYGHMLFSKRNAAQAVPVARPDEVRAMRLDLHWHRV